MHREPFLDQQVDLIRRQQRVAKAFSAEELEVTKPAFKSELEQLLLEALDDIISIPLLPHYSEIMAGLKEKRHEEMRVKYPDEFFPVYEYDCMRQRHGVRNWHTFQTTLTKDLQPYRDRKKIASAVKKYEAEPLIHEKQPIAFSHQSHIPHILRVISPHEMRELDWETQEELTRYVQLLRFHNAEGNFRLPPPPQTPSEEAASSDLQRYLRRSITAIVAALIRGKVKERYKAEWADIESFNLEFKNRLIEGRNKREEESDRMSMRIVIFSIVAAIATLYGISKSDCGARQPQPMIPDLDPPPAPINPPPPRLDR